MKLILLRHGETIENAKKIIQGHLHGKLSRRGLTQIRKLAKKLKDEKIDAIYSSDLARAKDSAKEIARFHKTVPLRTTKYLREQYYGRFQGKKSKELDLASDEIEDYKSMNDRIETFVMYLTKFHGKHTLIIVGHTGINRVLKDIANQQKIDIVELN